MVHASISFHQLVAAWLWDSAGLLLLSSLPPSFSCLSARFAVSRPMVRCCQHSTAAPPPPPEPWRGEGDGPACCICFEMRAGCTLGKQASRRPRTHAHIAKAVPVPFAMVSLCVTHTHTRMLTQSSLRLVSKLEMTRG